MPIRWKVTTQTRRSCVIYGEDFFKKYLKNTIVKADPTTLGIFLFKTKKNAEDFTKNTRGWIILKVKTVGEGKKPKEISGSISIRGLTEFYDNSETAKTEFMPFGTICYPAVEVLE